MKRAITLVTLPFTAAPAVACRAPHVDQSQQHFLP